MKVHRERILKHKQKQREKGRTMSEEELQEKLNQIFNQFDKNKDDALDLDEFKEMLEHIAFRKGLKGTKHITLEEVKRVLAKTDTDGNVMLDRHEFYDLYKHL
jgi:Ca2+-binding EF-hand superfamily protein